LKAIVLCGGLGTRLGALTRELPKPLVEVAGRPFLEHVLDQLLIGDIDEIVLAAGFCWQKIRDAIGGQWRGVKVSYSVEGTPLGTGGAIKLAFANSGATEAIVVNGDTLLALDVSRLTNFAQSRKAEIAIALKAVPDAGRFGRVLTDESGRIECFEEKGACVAGLINAGFYYMRADVFSRIDAASFSLEHDLLKARCADISMYGLPTDAYFIDMGIPADLARARVDLSANQ
jgi:D-glycero-alpha-D-manno-heptose 1-phosphate guanylyltransferase